MSPRRSSRARSSAIPQAPSQAGSSNSSTYAKNTRTAQRSESIEDSATLDGDASTEPMAPRRSRRNGAEDSRDPSQIAKQEPGLESMQDPLEDDPEEVTRCICGSSEYPGPTPSVVAAGKTSSVDPFNKDIGDFFVQCDKCLVWQHGGCMGFHDEANLPEEYYCELCKPKLHKIEITTHGKRSHYLPNQQPQPQPQPEKPQSSRSSSLSSGDPSKKESKNAMSESTRRRATMNSRGAYDEDEALRRAIEESNRELGVGTLGKRAREDGDESKPAMKRQRTGSVSSESRHSASPPATDDGSTKAGVRSKQSLRGLAAKNSKEREARDKAKEQQAAARAEAASKRNARSERRRGEGRSQIEADKLGALVLTTDIDSPPPSPSVSPSKALGAALQRRKDKAETPPASSRPAPKPKNSRNRGGRRVGRNQYTRDRDFNGMLDSGTPMGDMSEHNGNANGRNSPGHYNINGESGRSSKAKTHPARTSLNEMKRRVAAILEFVGQMQTQSSRHLAANKGGGRAGGGADQSGSGSSSEKGTPAAAAATAAAGVASLVKAVQAATEDVAEAEALDEDGDAAKGKLRFRDDGEFRDMGSTEMMEALTRELIAWQKVFGVYSK
ncbi:uncharacterized protein HMPREF1541_04473 [Cyphellophora europaea CBS 101466]|uniref:Zinc finger PHD-type domain-containing protein n=1 Tax=Cyphellophora europaea (strain CBS 101466) TaxID=1220924 RepID=W2RUS2_CYPE1|nr:uncharacterized protein HMPREF1541_04473 [Cyphellophora europaea CBS 101466]ETN40197.1 hypothetical protein HMPREF1541_04473 [Cyphellophora europaea CBS 101466]